MSRTDGLDSAFKALADPTRRRLLDLLRDGSRTTGDLCSRFDTTRFAVMKHLSVLEAAGLVVVESRGRERWNALNAVPIRRIYERWISPYEQHWASSLTSLKRHVESTTKGKNAWQPGRKRHRSSRASRSSKK